MSVPERQTMRTERSKIRVLLIAPSIDILGGQAVQAIRLLRGFSALSELQVDFQPINPCLPGRLREIPYVRTLVNLWSRLCRIRYLRTIITASLYYPAILWRIPRYDIVPNRSSKHSEKRERCGAGVPPASGVKTLSQINPSVITRNGKNADRHRFQPLEKGIRPRSLRQVPPGTTDSSPGGYSWGSTSNNHQSRRDG